MVRIYSFEIDRKAFEQWQIDMNIKREDIISVTISDGKIRMAMWEEE